MSSPKEILLVIILRFSRLLRRFNRTAAWNIMVVNAGGPSKSGILQSR